MDSSQFGGNIPLRRGRLPQRSYSKRYTVGPVLGLILFLLPLAFSAWVIYFWTCVAGYVNAWPF